MILDIRATGIDEPRHRVLGDRDGFEVHPLHKMMSRPGSIRPWLASHLVAKYSSRGDLVLDPFCGKGTILLEAALLGRRAMGFDTAPDAVVVTRAKIDPPSYASIIDFLGSLRFRGQGIEKVPWQVRTFFSRGTLAQILWIRDRLLAVLKDEGGDLARTANFVLGTFLGILHGHSQLSLSLSCSHSFAMSPRYVRRYAATHRLRKPYRDVVKCLLLRTHQLLAEDPPTVRGGAFIATADDYPHYGGKSLTNSVDLIVTSPPYLDMQTYAKDSWLRLWILGYDYRDIRRSSLETGSPLIYLSRMLPCVKEMLRVLKPFARAVIVAGDAPVVARGKRGLFRTAEEIGVLATQLRMRGFTFVKEKTFVDSIPSHTRYYSAVHKDGKKGNNDEGRRGVRVERVVVLRKVKV